MTVSQDARFEEGGARPLRLKALDADDLQVVSALVQDSVLPASEMTWSRKDGRFGLLLNRFRWEDPATTRSAERVQSVLCIENVMKVRSRDVPQGDKDMVLSVLAIGFEPGEDGTGTVKLILAGDGEVEIEVEALEVLLRDVTRPYGAPSGHAPQHPE